MRKKQDFCNTTDGAQIFYKRYGNAEPLFLISGLTGTSDSFNNIVASLGKFFTVVTFDNRGSGKTICDFSQINIERMAEDVKELADFLNFDKIHLLGFSMGGYISQLFALKYPERVDKLILSHTSSKVLDRNIDLFRTMADALEEGMSWKNWHKLFSQWVFTPDFFKNKEMCELVIEFLLNYEPHQTLEGFRAQLEARPTMNICDNIDKIKAKTLVIAGKQDILCPSYLSEDLALKIEGSKFVILDDAHMPILENKEMYLKTIIDFLGQN